MEFELILVLDPFLIVHEQLVCLLNLLILVHLYRLERRVLHLVWVASQDKLLVCSSYLSFIRRPVDAQGLPRVGWESGHGEMANGIFDQRFGAK